MQHSPPPDRSKKLVRQYKRYLGSKTAEQDILDLAGEIERHNSDLDVAVLRNFPAFSTAIDIAYSEYDDRFAMASRNIEISSKELTTALSEVETLNISINTMLNSLGQALLFFDETGICSTIHSKSTHFLLGADPGDKMVTDVVPFSPQEKENFQRWLSIAFGGNLALDFDDLKELLPQEFQNDNGRFIELDYKPMYFYKGNMMGVLLIGTDVTEQKEAEERLDALKAHNKKTLAISSNRNGFRTLIKELRELIQKIKNIEKLEDAITEKRAIMRQFHTYKGLAGIYNLDNMIQQIHKIETECTNLQDKTSFKSLCTELNVLDDILTEDSDFACNIFEEDFMSEGHVSHVPIENLIKLKDMIQGAESTEAALAYLNKSILSVPLEKELRPFKSELRRLAEQFEKPLPEITINTDDISVFPNQYEEVFETFIHIARNIIDHGIEGETKRLEYGKPAHGCVCVSAKIHAHKDGDVLNLTIADDGRGIDPDKIRQKLQKDNRDVPDSMSEQEIIDHIFEPAFSLNTDISIISGRGIGMDAVKKAVLDAGGTISVTSDYENKKGTTLHINLPYKQD